MTSSNAPVNTETSGGTRYSSGKPIRTWTPWRGLDAVYAAWEDFGCEVQALDEMKLVRMAESHWRYAMNDPTQHRVTLATMNILVVLHKIATGSWPSTDGYPVSGLDFVCDIAAGGAVKYAEFDWNEGQTWTTLLSSGHRHICDVLGSGDVRGLDADSGQLTLAHAAWNGLCMLDFYAQGREHELNDVSCWIGVTAAQKREKEAATIHDPPEGHSPDPLSIGITMFAPLGPA
jgi:dATP/dGTP diphosphohydrolase, N-terminal